MNLRCVYKLCLFLISQVNSEHSITPQSFLALSHCNIHGLSKIMTDLQMVLLRCSPDARNLPKRHTPQALTCDRMQLDPLVSSKQTKNTLVRVMYHLSNQTSTVLQTHWIEIKLLPGA